MTLRHAPLRPRCSLAPPPLPSSRLCALPPRRIRRRGTPPLGKVWDKVFHSVCLCESPLLLLLPSPPLCCTSRFNLNPQTDNEVALPRSPSQRTPPYRNFVDPRCLRPSLSCKRPLRAVAGGSSLSRPPGRGLQSSSSPSSTITDERFAQPLPLPELEHAPSESLSLQRSILPPARSTTGRLRHPSIYQLQSAVVGRPYLPVRPHSQLPGTCAPPNV